MEFLTIVLDSSIRLMVPLLLATLGELISQRSGVLNVGLEGMMAAGAFAGFFAVVLGFSLPAAILIAILCGALAGGLMAVGAVWLKGNHILVGFSLFILLPGLANFILVQGSASASTPAVHEITVPYLSAIPIIGGALFSQNIFYYLAVVLTVLVWVMFSRTQLGLVISSVGHDPARARTKGISPVKVQTLALLACGALAGLGGAALSLGSVGSFTPNIIGGRGFIVIAIVILGRWTVTGAVVGAILMGLLEAMKLNLPQLADVPIQLLGALPWIVVIAMLIFSARLGSNAPRSLVT
ncbi:ABC transporter permease (plasmid) [Rhizobium sp. TRM96647]|uniref:ABC transporter permease n=1 Tax=unclassified Rhizobium TaxID=2613769 RepID=UPI0021E894A5|nr:MULTISPECIES: ABC transporter permease [unclassified Rhizobium]MCV3735168.1 ABC transporter permease [Rhizobium sp. TRM96647]MCV3758068.1 ABC transporter permease [Rhizobium sp. TRM96650]